MIVKTLQLSYRYPSISEVVVFDISAVLMIFIHLDLSICIVKPQDFTIHNPLKTQKVGSTVMY